MSTRKRKRQVSMNALDLLDEVLLREIIRFVGDYNFRIVAGINHRFNRGYQEVFGTCTTSVEEMVSTVSGAELFLNEASSRSRFCIRKKDLLSFYSTLNWMRLRPLEFVRDTAAWNGRLEVLQWAVSRGCLLDNLSTSFFAAFGGKLSVLQYVRGSGCPWDEYTCDAAAFSGNLAMLQWAHANDCPWDALTCSTAARQGHLAVLQWARANGCSWNSSTCSCAAMNGHLAVLQWARSNGCPWDKWTYVYAARRGHLSVVEWARANGCPEG